MVYKFAMGLGIALLLSTSRLSHLPGLNLLSNLYTGFPSGVEGITLLLLRVGTGVLFMLHGFPPENKEAAYIQAFKFRDPDRHPLELIWFPPDKGQEKWHQKSDCLFLGIDHTAIAIKNTEQSLQFYRDFLGMRVDGGSFNWGETQAKLDGLPNAKVGITALRPTQGGLGIELLNYIEPANGRPILSAQEPYDIAYVQVELIIDEINKGSARLHQNNIHPNYQIKDPTGHSLLLIFQQKH